MADLSERPLAVTCYGPISIDHIFQTGDAVQPRLGRETFAHAYSTALGGGAGIVAVTLARLGLPSSLVSRVGADPPGIGLLTQLRAEGVDVSHVQVLCDQATDVSVAFTCATDRGFLSHVAASKVLDHVQMESPCLARTRHLHLCLSPTEVPDHWRGLIHQAHEVGATVSIDLGWQLDWDLRFCDWLGEADIIFPNETEALHLAHTRSLDRAMKLLGARGATVVIKRGVQGALAFRDGQRLDVPPMPVTQVVDSTGAGDMFAAGFLWAFLGDHPLCSCLRAGSLCGARCVEQCGGLATPPTRADLEAAIWDTAPIE